MQSLQLIETSGKAFSEKIFNQDISLYSFTSNEISSVPEFLITVGYCMFIAIILKLMHLYH